MCVSVTKGGIVLMDVFWRRPKDVQFLFKLMCILLFIKNWG